MMVKVKVCGITNIADALAAAEHGVEMLGFVFAESPRRISPEQAVLIVNEIPSFIAKVGVFVNEKEETVREIAEVCALDALQFHGSETPEYCRAFGVTAIKAFRVKDEASLLGLTRYGEGPFLMDTFIKNTSGGTGETFDWGLAVASARSHRIILSGGLRPDNVGMAIRRVQPFAVDVSSGVEAAPGIKDAKKLRAFMTAVQEAGEAS
jgi:phosphoribosylanthranilate isomerase